MATPLILLPGMDGTGKLFSPFIEKLPSWIEPIVVRYPPNAPMGYPALKEIAKMVLPGDRPFVILGESFSGPIAVSIASEGSAGLRGVILSTSFVTWPHAWSRRFERWLPFIPFHASARLLGPPMLTGRWTSLEGKNTLLEALRNVSPEVLRARVGAALAVDVSAELRDVKVPALYLQAEEDRVVPSRAATEFARIAPDGRIVQLAGPHFLLQSVPAEAARVVSDFVNRLPSIL